LPRNNINNTKSKPTTTTTCRYRTIAAATKNSYAYLITI
jgi:hypothetical protein